MPGKHRTGLRGRGATVLLLLVAALLVALAIGLFSASGDVIRGGRAYDVIKGTNRADVIRARDGHLDYIDCRGGRDVAYVDRAEDGVVDCERVVMPTSAQRRASR